MEPHSGLGWLTALDRVERTTCATCFGARVLESMDAHVYALLLPSILLTFHLSTAQVGFLGTCMGLGAAVTTTFAGMAADRFGRLRVMRAALLIASVVTVMLAFADGLWSFALLRGVQGMAYGAEMVASITMVTEVVRRPWRARAAAAVQSGQAAGYMMALVAILGLHRLGLGSQGWRWLFALGVTPGIYGLLLPRLMPESRSYLEIPPGEAKPPLATLIAPRFLRATLLTGAVGVGVFGAAQVMMVWLPIFLQNQLHNNIGASTGFLAINIAGAAMGPWIYGPLSDRWGRKMVFILFLLLQSTVIVAFIAFIYMGIALAPFPFIFMLGLFQGGLAIGIQPIIAELYPTALRARAIGLSTSFIKGTAALPPALVGIMAMTMPMGWAMSMVATTFYGVALTCLLLLPATRRPGLTVSPA